MKPSTIIKESSSGINEISLDAHLLSQGKVFLEGEITNELSMDFFSKMLYLEELGLPEITIYINSPGGSVSAGMAICDTINQVKCDVSTVCTGMAASMAAVILSAGTKGRRIALPHSRIMIHEPLVTSTGGSTSSIKETADQLLKTKTMINSFLADHTGKSVKEIDKVMDGKDFWMDADAAVRFGLCDHIGLPMKANR